MADLEQLITKVQSQMSRGQMVLMTGAGFSLDARNARGVSAPSSAELRDLLLQIAYPGEEVDKKTSLSDAFAVAVSRNRGQVQTLFEDRLSFAADSLPVYYRLFFEMPWYRIYTLNIDDLEAAVARRFSLQRRPSSISATTLMKDGPVRPGGGSVDVVHLNGMLSDGPAHWTFSDIQYGGRTASPDSWYARCAVDLRSRPVIYVGTDLNEGPLWQHIELRRRQGIEAEINPPGSILVSPTLSRARADMLRSFSVELVQMTAKEFAEKVLAHSSDAARRGMVFLGTYDDTYGRAGVPLVSDLAAERPTLETEFLRGEEPEWADILQGRACLRNHDAALEALSRDILAGRRGPAALAVTGTAGSGKSTALMRLALRFSNEGVPVLWVDRASQADIGFIHRRLAEFDEKVVLAIDDAEVFGTGLARFIRDSVPQRPHVLVVVALSSGRADELKAVLTRTNEVSLLEHTVPTLSDEDVDGLIGVLERHNRLGILAGSKPDVRRRAFTEKCGRQLIVAMIEATTGELFEQKLEKELHDLPGLQQFVYAVVCIASQFKFFLTRDEVLLAAQGLPGGDAFEALTLLVRRHVVVSPPPGVQHRARHHVVADVVFTALRRDGRLFGPLKAIIHALASKADPNATDRRDRVWSLLRRLTSHDFLNSETSHISEARQIYSSIETLLAGNYHYWLQRGSLEVEAGDLSSAELFLNQSRSLAPDDYRVNTEFGYLLMRKAIADPRSHKARNWVTEGMALLEAVITARGEADHYPYHVLGAQGLAWARRVEDLQEKRRLLSYVLNVVKQGLERHPQKRDLEQLRTDIQRDLLMTVADPS